ncbi:potassium channel, putative [Plasmodium ovale]|uniref:Potassium channel, putative n=2 Tax=Plasmodium ovale TaxID=36330 RepID=A0A1A8WV14_PLAOA|nr:potassium channel, putative [Plasmodium ovale curtisi]SBS96798.1 potassium channel, putative [Plasmodium ovale curtisi]SCP05627.1 potassium channel, putative [Plasmodium ovale]
MKSGLLSINDIIFLVKNIFKYFLIFLNGLYLIKLPQSSKESIDYVSGAICIGIGVTLKIVLIAIYWIYFMDIYMLKKCRKKNFLNLFNLNKIDRDINATTMIESDDFEYKKLIKKFFFKKVYYSVKKKHKMIELYMLKIYNSTFNYYFCNIRDILYTTVWYISLYYWRRDAYDIIWDLNKIPSYIYNMLIVLLSSSYIDLVMIILSYNKSKYYVMKSKLLIDIFFSAPCVFFFYKHVLVLKNQIDIYFVMGFLRNIKIFLNVSYARIEQNYILTNTEIKIIRIVLGVLLLCNAFASTIYTIQAIHPYHLENGNFQYFLHSYLDYFYFSIISISTVGYGDIFPINKLSKIVCIFFIFWTFIWVPIQFNDLIISIFSKKKTYGKISINSQNFILLIGDVEPQQLNVFLFESIAYGNKLKFHILTTYPIHFYEEQIEIANNFCISMYIKNFDLNEKQNTNLLYSINAQNASYLFLFSDKFNNGHYNIDTKSFTRLLILKKFLHGKKNAVIELRNKCVSNVIKSIGCENFIIVNLKHSLIVKNLKHPGFITLILNLFTAYNYDANSYNFNDIQTFPSLKYLAEFNRGSRTKIFSFLVHKNMVGLKFDKLFHRLYESLGIILIGIETVRMNSLFTGRDEKKEDFLIKSLINIIKKKKKKKKHFKFTHLHLLKKYLSPLIYLKQHNGKRCTTSKSNLLKMGNISDNYMSEWDQTTLICGDYNNGLCEGPTSTDRDNSKNSPLRRKKKNSAMHAENYLDVCINIENGNTCGSNAHDNNISSGNCASNKPKRRRWEKGDGKTCEDLTNWDYNIIHTKTNARCSYHDGENKGNRKLMCYLNLLGKNYAMKESDKCIVIANSKKVIKYLSKAKSLFWLFEIKRKKNDKIAYDLKSVIKTKRTFNKYFAANVKKEMTTISSMQNKIIINKNADVIAMNYHDLFNTYKIGKIFAKRSYSFEGKSKKDVYAKVRNISALNRGTHTGIRRDTDPCNADGCNDNRYNGNISNCRHVRNWDHEYSDEAECCLTYPNLNPCGEDKLGRRMREQTEIFPHCEPSNRVDRRKNIRFSMKPNLNDTALFRAGYVQFGKKGINYFYYRRRLKKKHYLNGSSNVREEDVKLKKKIKNDQFDRAVRKIAVAYSYVEACEKYFVHSNSRKLLLLINCTSNISQLIKMINRKYKYNIVILTDEIPTVNIWDLYKYNVVFIKCKSLDDYNLLNAGLIEADYVLILPTEAANISEINEIDMNSIILMRKIAHLLKKKKKTYFVNNIITELINPSNIIFLEENKMIKLKEKKSFYSDFFPYVNSSQFFASNIICETMLYNFMTHHKSFTKFSVCNDTLKCLVKNISIIYICDLNKYFNFSFKKIKTFRDVFYFLAKKNIITIGLYRKGDKNVPFYVYTKPSEKCVLRLDDVIYIL